MDNKTKFQPISRKFDWAALYKIDQDQNGIGTEKGYCDVEFVIDENIDKRYNQCVGITIKTTGDFTTNVNGEISQPILIDDVEVFPVGFDTGLAFPMEQNREFTNFKYPIALNNSKVEGRIKFHFSGFGTSEPTDSKKVIYNAQVVLHLENRDKSMQEVSMNDIKASIDNLARIITEKK